MSEQNNEQEMPMRIRIKFAKLPNIRFIGHLDLFRAWERTIRRAKLPVKYSLGFNPRQKINLASALPLGLTSEAEIMDMILNEHIPITKLENSLNESLPQGIQILEITEIPIDAPKLQKTILAAEYIASFEANLPDEAIIKFLNNDQIIRERRGKSYNLRPLIHELILLSSNDNNTNRLYMKLSARDSATGRPDEVLSALGIDPLLAFIHRIGLIFKD